MRADWIPITHPPREAGTYLVTTAKGAVILDRWDGETWGRCTPRLSLKHRHGRYPMHRAWTYLPQPSTEEVKE